MALAQGVRHCLCVLLPLLSLTQASSAPALPGLPGAYLTSEVETRTFAWGPPNRTVAEAFEDAFPGGNDSWVNVSFVDAAAESGAGASGATITAASLVEWIDSHLLGGPDPFAAHGGRVPVPWPAAANATDPADQDQLRPGHWVGYSRRQVCYIVAKSLVGAGTEGYKNGLLRYLEKVSNGGCQARRGAFGRAYFVLLAACAADPTLAAGGQGPLLLAAKAAERLPVDEVKELSHGVGMDSAGLRMCQYDDGVADIELPRGGRVGRVPAEGCSPPKTDGPGRDFMTGGLKGQAVQDISAAFLGGYVFGYDCGLGGGQDERLMTYMPEVGALTFFLSQSTYRGGDEHPHPQLRQPAWILGARQLFIGLDGTGRFTAMLERDPLAPLTSDLVPVSLQGKTYSISSSRPFLAFMSENQGFIPEGPGTNDTRLARQNLHPNQRAVEANSSYAFGRQVRAWFSSVALTSYSPDVQPALRGLVKSLGSGPWLAGLWWGDSQLGLLSVWLGHALAARTWGSAGLPLDYYVYSAFTENPGNQCLLHSGDACQACLAHCAAKPLPKSAYWLPEWAFFGPEEELKSSCTPSSAPCGRQGLAELLERYGEADVKALWEHVERVLQESDGSTTSSVFDLLMPTPRLLL